MNYLTATQLSREAKCSVGKIINYVSEGLITPAGRAGSGLNSAIIFSEADLPRILETLKGVPTPVGGRRPCRSAAAVEAKASALLRAREEASA